MKFCSRLPDRSFYKSLSVSPDKDYFLFEDIASKAIRIKSPVADPFENKPWGLAFQHQKQKSDFSEYPYRLVIKLVKIDSDAIECNFERNTSKGVYTYSKDAPLLFLSFPIELGSSMFRFVNYSLYSVV